MQNHDSRRAGRAIPCGAVMALMGGRKGDGARQVSEELVQMQGTTAINRGNHADVQHENGGTNRRAAGE